MKKSFFSLALCLFLVVPDISSQTSNNPYPQFLFPDFSKGIVKMKDGRRMTATMNYNTVDEEMLFDQKGVYMALDKPQDIDTVYLKNRKFIPVGNAFYQVASEGHITLFVQNKGKYTQPGANTAYGMTSPTAGPNKVLAARSGNQVRTIDLPENVIVSPATVYWVKTPNNEMFQFANVRQFLKLFPDKSDKLKEFISKNKINLQSEDDLAKLGSFCSSLF